MVQEWEWRKGELFLNVQAVWQKVGKYVAFIKSMREIKEIRWNKMRLLDESGGGLNKIKKKLLRRIREWNENVKVKCKCKRESTASGHEWNK